MTLKDVKCPEGHDDIELRHELQAPEGKLAVLCRKCLELFYIENPGIQLL